MRWKISLFSITSVILAVAGLRFVGTQRWQSNSRSLRERLTAGQSSHSPTTYKEADLAGLPAPVQRYFRAVLQPGQATIRAAHIAHNGTFNMGNTEARWVPFTSAQHVITHRPGFLWDARMRMAPGLPVYVRDAYVGGEGLLQAKLFGLVPVVSQTGTPELAQGELMRFLAEAAWYPTALLPGQGVRWTAIDASQAKATLTDGATTVELVFTFDAAGLIETVRATGRYRDVDGQAIATPWEGRFWNYEWRQGVRIPVDGEVAWISDGQPQPYWRGHLKEIEFEPDRSGQAGTGR